MVAFCWQVGIVAALYGVVRVSQRLLSVAAGQSPLAAPSADGGHRTAMLWTAVAIWIEPLRSTFDYGQVNVILVLGVLYAVYSSRWWLSGLLVGLAAGVKLTPAVTGLYFLGMRRWGAAIFSATVFLATVGLSIAVIGQQARALRIGDAPHGGRSRDDLAPGLRTVPFEASAVIAYRVGAAVEIANVFYGGRDYEALYRDGAQISHGSGQV